jgi:hypothetical protein
VNRHQQVGKNAAEHWSASEWPRIRLRRILTVSLGDASFAASQTG